VNIVCKNGDSSNKEIVQFVTTVLNRPYNTSDKSWPETIRDHFLGSEFTIDYASRQKEECRTLGWAYLNESVTLGFNSSPFWREPVHEIKELSLEEGERDLKVLCVTEEKHIKNHFLQKWIVSQQKCESPTLPCACELQPHEKKIKYRDDHGREILDDFARRLVKSKYVVGVINSLPWHPQYDHFIISCRRDGIVNVCLHWHDKGYGLAIQTMAKGLSQTELVAKVLEKEFDQRT
jgi:hypothetical protein